MILHGTKVLSWLVVVVAALLSASVLVDAADAGATRGGNGRIVETRARNIPIVAAAPHARILEELHSIGEVQHRGLNNIWIRGDRDEQRKTIEALDAAVGMPVPRLTDQEISARIGDLVHSTQQNEDWTHSHAEYRDENLQFLADKVIEAVRHTSGAELRELAPEAFWHPYLAKVAIAKLMKRQSGDAYQVAIAIALLPKDEMRQLIEKIQPDLQTHIVIEKQKAEQTAASGTALRSESGGGGSSPISGPRNRYDAHGGGAYSMRWILLGRACTDQDRRDWRPGLRAPDEQFEILRGRDTNGAFFLVGEAYRFKFEDVASSALVVTVHTACDDNGVLLLGEPHGVQLTQSRKGAQTCGRAARMSPRGEGRAAIPTLMCATDRDYSVGFKVVAR